MQIHERITAATKTNNEKTIRLGVSYIDDAINGIVPETLLVLGGGTGIGKTELAIQIAMHVANTQGKRVRLLALERGRDEIHLRLVFKKFAPMFFENKHEFGRFWLDWSDFVHGALPLANTERYKEILKQACIEVERDLRLIDIIPDAQADPEISRQGIAQCYENFANDSDLVILDHLHMLSNTDEDRGDYEAVVNNVKTLRESITKHQVPMVLFSHLRKRDKFARYIVPPIEELHGSSEISKKATDVITFSRVTEVPTGKGETKGFADPVTLFKVEKSRWGYQSARNYVGVCRFDPQLGGYEQRYYCAKLRGQGEFDFLTTTSKVPRWMGANVKLWNSQGTYSKGFNA